MFSLKWGHCVQQPDDVVGCYQHCLYIMKSLLKLAVPVACLCLLVVLLIRVKLLIVSIELRPVNNGALLHFKQGKCSYTFLSTDKINKLPYKVCSLCFLWCLILLIYRIALRGKMKFNFSKASCVEVLVILINTIE